MKKRVSLLLFLALLSLPAFLVLRFQWEKSRPTDTWYASPSDLYADATKFNSLHNTEIYVVTDAMFPAAERMLQHKPVAKISDAQVSSLTGKSFQKARGKSPYLVRALYFKRFDKQFQVYYLGKKLWVESAILGHSGGMARAAIVVLLQHQPDEVFITLSSAV